MFYSLINVSFLAIILTPVLIMFLTLIKNIGEELRKSEETRHITRNKNQPIPKKKKANTLKKKSSKLRKVK